ncbi:MAG: PRC-barrel domain-containing protein [Chloroflexota bacterium]|jgi:uncharacterized protein YrrD
MRKGKSVIGKPILSLADGARLHEVKDVILGPGNDAVVGLLADEGGFLASSRVVPIEEVMGFGRDAVVVARRESVVAANDLPEINDILSRHQSLLGTRVFTETGDDQGKINDVYFDEPTGRILGFELSGGVFTDAAHGTRYIPLEELVRVGPDVAYVFPETADLLEQQRGGLSGALADVGDKAKTAAGDATRGAKTATADARPEDNLVGKRTGRDVEDGNGAILVPAGRRVTSDDIERARAADKLPDLTTAVGLGEAGLAAAGAKDAIGSAGDNAASLWDKFTRKVGEMTDAAGQRVDHEQTKRRLDQIEDAVGRPVTKVILDLEDRVILDLGDLITHAAIQRAHEAGALDSLLGSVYKGEVTFQRDEMRAEKQGEAALELASRPGISAPVVEDLRAKVDDTERRRDEEAEAKKVQVEQDRQRRETERAERSRVRQTEAKKRDQDGPTAPATPI